MEPEQALDPVESDESGQADDAGHNERGEDEAEDHGARHVPAAAAKSRTSTARTSVTMIEPMTAIPIQSVPFEKSSQLRLYGQGQLKGAVQPPKKERCYERRAMKTLTYSAKKKKPKRIPSTRCEAGHDSESASVMSKGVGWPRPRRR